MKTISLLLILSGIVLSCQSQPLKVPYKFSYQIDSIYRMDSDESHAGTSYSRIGDHAKALDFFKIYWRQGWHRLNQDSQEMFKAYHAEYAEQYIAEEAKNARVIIINEGHHLTLHRAFVEKLLPALRKEGYDMLAMEAFNTDDTDIAMRGYPVLNSGTYCVDPCYGNMIRQALHLHYTLIAYETDSGRGAQREVDQANNLYEEISKHPISKFIVYCGYDHLIKDTMPGDDSWHHAMAGWLRLKGIDALTIDQTVLTETGVDSFDNPYRRLIHADKPVVMISDKGEPLKAKKRYNADITVYHPDATYTHGRARWQITDEKRTANINKKIKIAYPVLSQVYRAGENYETAVPTDVIEIKSKGQDVHVILEKGYKNVILLRNPKGDKQLITE